MRGISENSPTRAMAEELDVEAMLEAPYRKGVRINYSEALWSFILYSCVRVPDLFFSYNLIVLMQYGAFVF